MGSSRVMTGFWHCFQANNPKSSWKKKPTLCVHHFYVIYSWPCYWYLATERNSNQIRTMGWRAPHPSAIHPSAPGQPLQTGHAVMVRKRSCSLNKALSRKWVNKLRKTIFLRTRALCPLSFPAAHPLPSPTPCFLCLTAYATVVCVLMDQPAWACWLTSCLLPLRKARDLHYSCLCLSRGY